MTGATWNTPGGGSKALIAQESRFPASLEATDKQQGGAPATADGSQSGGRFRKIGNYLRNLYMRRMWEKQ